MNAGKRITALLVLSMFLIAMSLYPVMAQSTSGDNGKKTMNLVIVLDRTGSLQQSDPNRLSQEAAKLIVDLMVQNGSKIGLVQYTDKVTDRLDITDINGQGEKNKLKSYIDGLGVPKGQSTDSSTGLKEGVSMLAGLQMLENPVIVLLTDGKNDFNGSDRNQDISQRDMKQALDIAKNKEILIYTIGLNADGSVDKNMLSRIAKETGGKSYIVDKANDLPDIISNVYTDALGYKLLSLGSDRNALSGNFETYDFDVTNSSVAEANVVIYKNRDVLVKLIKPDGTEASWDNDRFIASPSQNYMSYKILNPNQGQWKLMVKGTRNDEIKISLLYNYDLVIHMDQLSSSSFTGAEIPVKVNFMRQGRAIEDKNLYKDMSAVAVVENSSANTSEKVPLTAGEKYYQGKIKFEQPGNYSVYVLAEGKALTRKSGPQTIQVTEKNVPVMASPKNLIPWKKLLYTLLGIIGATAFVILLLKGIPKLIENAKPKLLFGKINLRVINTTTGVEEMQQSKTLAPYGTSVTISKLAENPASTLNTIVIARKAQGVYLTYSEAGSKDLSVSVNGDKVAPGQIVLLTNGCSLRVVAVVDSIKVFGRFSEF
ncbi:VWA domain-containing protein [Desulfosporosinus sp. Sb-LF]|uniref:vWA domain-containing protein n=1 Tax=Desulfosporosinus sp. Sb-LF TaxID=2560027 RepID=UPI00107FADAB|nr:VWA domain-containing protein [Desulfosporosinus sp. Sb-LF]TGE32221.1 VWA domain-containing protein [Desulfosporosinus sp. Sb-LF]